MEDLNIQQIDDKNINFKFYKRRINDWNHDGSFEVGNSFHAIYLGDLFAAAGVVSFDKEASEIKIALLNNSVSSHDYIQKEATKQLSTIAQEQYGKLKVRCL